MFIGGLNWETTDRMLHPIEIVLRYLVECNLTVETRIAERLLLPIRGGTRMHRNARQCYWPLSRLWFLDIQGPQDCQHCDG